MKISASLYSSKIQDLSALVTDPELAEVDMWHLDCHDDLAVFQDIELIRKLDPRPIDLHVITPNPAPFLEQASRNEVEQVSFQYESLNQEPFFYSLPATQLGIAVLPATDIRQLETALASCSFVLCMATNPGVSGKTFNPSIIDQAAEIRRLYPEKGLFFDGGINEETIQWIRHLSPDVVVSGSYLLTHEAPNSAIRNLKNQPINGCQTP